MPHRAGAQRLRDIAEALERIRTYCDSEIRARAGLEVDAEALERIRTYCDGLSFEQFTADSRTVEAVQFNFIVIGEAARHLSDDIVARRPDLPWAEMRGLRNVVTHAYFAVSLDILWQTITNDLPPLAPMIQALIDESAP